MACDHDQGFGGGAGKCGAQLRAGMSGGLAYVLDEKATSPISSAPGGGGSGTGPARGCRAASRADRAARGDHRAPRGTGFWELETCRKIIKIFPARIKRVLGRAAQCRPSGLHGERSSPGAAEAVWAGNRLPEYTREVPCAGPAVRIKDWFESMSLSGA